MELFVFLDLDDTVFQTQRKCPPNTVITPATFLKEGSTNSFFTKKQQHLFNLLKANTRLIPTTGRDYASFLRVPSIQTFDYAIINYGGIILNAEGSVDKAWFNLIASKINPLLSELKTLTKYVETMAKTQSIPLKIRLVADFGLTFYLSIKHHDRDPEVLKAVSNQIIKPYLNAQQLDFYCHLNDNNLAVFPQFLNKAPAVSYLLQQFNQTYANYLSFGVGDSLTDMPYMQLCDYFITPTNSQILQKKFLG
ncbi:MAG: HAD family hydrolase [Methylococcales bacterium]|nr:HAD family hydrolase [Methylococcales bacterium]